MDSREDIPRVSVDTVHDWQRLRSNCKNAALAHLQAQIGATSLGDEQDTLLSHMNQFIDLSFGTAQPNLRVNGHNYEALNDKGDMEPFDEALDRRIWSLADTRLQWHRRIAETRRSVPLELGTSISSILDQQRANDPEITEPLDDLGEEVLLKTGESFQHIQEAISKTSALFEELDQTITLQQDRAERVRSATAEVNVLKP